MYNDELLGSLNRKPFSNRTIVSEFKMALHYVMKALTNFHQSLIIRHFIYFSIRQTLIDYTGLLHQGQQNSVFYANHMDHHEMKPNNYQLTNKT